MLEKPGYALQLMCTKRSTFIGKSMDSLDYVGVSENVPSPAKIDATISTMQPCP
jgi:hypothetical protein